LKGKPDQVQVLEEFFRKFGTSFRFVAWNMTFDVGFFKKMCFENGFGIEFDRVNYRHLDLQSMFFFYCKQRELQDLISLNDACKHFHILRSNYHSALEDADITYEVFKNLMLFK
jgi:DNA polymerase III subunit epsilon